MSKNDLDKQGDGGGKPVECPVCGTLNPAKAKVCESCDFTFGAEADASSPIICGGCGAELPQGTDACFICGAELNGKGNVKEVPEKAEAQAEEEWDPGTVGGEAAPSEGLPEEDIAADVPEDASAAEGPAGLGENEFRCPSCAKPVPMGTSKCPKCWADLPEMVRCPKCNIIIALDSDTCPECFAKLRNGVLIEEAAPAEESPKADELADEPMPREEELEEQVIEETTEIYTVECPFCHAEANAGDDICPECGMPLIEEDQAEERKLGAEHKYRKPEHDWYRITAVVVVIILLVSGILPFALPLPHVDRQQIRIDGAFGDWEYVTGVNDTINAGINQNVDLVDYKMLSDSFNVYFYMQVAGTAFGDYEGDTARIFIDTDQDASTGYSIMGLGADYEIRVFGHSGTVESSSCLRFDGTRPQNDFNGFHSYCPSVPHTSATLEDNEMFEVRVALDSIGIGATQPVSAVFYMADSQGDSDYSDTPLTNLGSILFVKQSSLVPASGILTGSAAPALQLEMLAIGQQFSIAGLDVPQCTGQFTATMAPGARQTVNLTTSASSLGSGTFISREASPADFDVPDAHVIVTGQGAFAYANSAPAAIAIDGAFADWNGKGSTTVDAAGDQLAKNGMDHFPDDGLDMLSQTTAVESSRLNVMVETAGAMLAGMWVPEIEESYVNTAQETTRADTADSADSDHTYTQPDVSTRAPNIQRPSARPVKTGEGAVNVFIDSDNNASTGYLIGGIGADFLAEVLGQDGKVTRTNLSEFSGTDQNLEEWTSVGAVTGASSGSRVEIGIPLTEFGTAIDSNATAVIQVVDWNLNGDLADLTLWDIFESATRGTREDWPPKIGGMRGSTFNDDGKVSGATVIMVSELNNRITTFISANVTNPLYYNYAMSQGFGYNFYVKLYGVTQDGWGYERQMYPPSDDMIYAVWKNISILEDKPGVAPVDFQLTNLAPYGTRAIQLTWNHATNPASFNVYRTDLTTNYLGYEGRGRYYGVNQPRYSGLASTATSYIDTFSDAIIDKPALNQTNYYIIQATDGSNYNYSVELSIVADFWAPGIVHTNKTYFAGAQAEISANITDGVGVRNATLHYRKQGAGAYTEKPMALYSGNDQAGDWRSWIPIDQAAPQTTYEYYISSTDGTLTSYWGSDVAPIVMLAEPAPDDPYPIYGYVYWNNTPPTPVPGANVFVQWESYNGTIISQPGAFPVVSNALGQYSIDTMFYDSDSTVWANATYGTASGYNVTQVVIGAGGEQVDIYLEAPLLNITKTAPAAANPDQDIAYTITVRNLGNTTAYNVVVTETYPPEVSYVTATPLPTVPFNNVWNIPYIIPGGTYTITITVHILAGTPTGTVITNYARADYTNSIGTPWPYESATAETLIGAALLDITKWAPAYVNPGQQMTYWLNYTNLGTQWAENVTVTETYPAGVSFVSATPAPTFGNNIWNVGMVAPGGTGAIQITVLVALTATGTLMNRANITAPGMQVNWTFANTTVINPNIVIDKTAPATANAGETISYQITYQNTGLDTAYNVVITETYPAAVTPVGQSSSPPVTYVWPGTWLVGTLAPGASGTITVTVTIAAGYTGTLVNLAEASYRNNVVDMPVSRDWANTTVANPMLNVDKTVQPFANTGEQIVYTIHVWNSGTATAYNVVVTDALPAGTIYVPVATPPPTSVVGTTLTWNIASIGAGASVWINITVQVGTTASGVITNTATAVWEDAAGQDFGPVSDDASFTVADPLMAISKDGPASANSGQQITYWINYTNSGMAAAYNVNITEAYPAGVSFVSSIPAPTYGDDTWVIPIVPAGGSGGILITVQIAASATGTITNWAYLDYDDGSGEDQADVSDSAVTVLDNPLLIVSKVAPEFANPGQDITYTIVVMNMGSEPAYNVVVTEAYPAGVTFVTAIPMPTSGDNIWSIGTLPVGLPYIITVTVHIGEATTGDLVNTVVADYQSSSGQDYQANDTATTTVTWPIMNIQKTGPLNATAGGTIMYTISYWNSGSDTAYDVVITETYPAGVSFLNANPMPTSGNNVWSVGDVAPGTGGTIFVNVTISAAATGILVNTVGLGYNNSADEAMDPVYDTWDTYLSGPWMNIVKTGPATANTGEQITYTLHYWNSGDDTAYGIWINETYPAGTTFVSASPAPTTPPGTWYIASLAAGAHGWINITVSVNEGVAGDITNWAYIVYENDAGVLLPQNETSWTVTVLDPMMVIDKTGPATANPGGSITYTISYQNIGSGTAYNVVITDTLPAGTSYVSSSPAGTVAGQVVTWNIGTLPSGEGGTVSVTVTVTATSGTLVNTASIGYEDEAGQDQDEVSDVVYTTIINPYLTITKTGPATAAPGQLITYTIRIDNIGNDWAYNVWLNDTLPAGVSFADATPGYIANDPTYSWFVAALAPGGSYSVWITVQITATSGTVVNTANVTYENAAEQEQDVESDTWPVAIVNCAITINKIAPATANTGEQFTYTITYQNTGFDQAYNVTITDTLPAGVAYVSSVPAGSVAGSIITWFFPAIGPNSAGTITVTVNVNLGLAIGTVLNNTAVLDYENVAHENYQGIDWAETTIEDPILSITKTAQANAAPGEIFSYTITYENTGNDPATDVVVTDTLPAGVVYVSAVPVPTTIAGQVLTWDIGNLGPLMSGSITVTVQVTATSGILTNSVEIVGNNLADVEFTDSDTADVAVIGPSVSIAKTGPATAAPGETITYTISYMNTGNGIAYDVMITDTLPADVTYVSSNPPGALALPTITWNLGNLNPGQGGTITITVTVNLAATLLVNHASLLYYTDGALTNPVNGWSNWTTVVDSPLLEITKTAPATAVIGETIAYVITVTNSGNNDARSVVVVDTLPVGVLYVSDDSPFASAVGQVVTWNVGLLPAGQTRTLTITAIIEATAGNPLINIAYADHQNQAFVAQPRIWANATTTLVAPLLTIDKTAPAYANTGELIQYTVTVTNTGTAPAYNIMVVESYPVGMSFVSSIPLPSWGDYRWNVSFLDVGASFTITITLEVTAGSGTLTNIVIADYTNFASTDMTPAVDTAATMILNPYIVVSKTSPSEVNPGETFTYWITYQNLGSDVAYNVTITEFYPPGVSFVSSTPGPTSGNNVWVFGAVAAGGNGSIEITVQVGLGTNGWTLVNNVSLDYQNGADIQQPTAYDEATTVVVQPAVTITKTAPSTAVQGQNMVYRIVVQNTGTDTAYGVIITDAVPAGTSFISSVPPPTSPDVWVLGDIAPGASRWLNITVQIGAATTGIIVNWAYLDYQNAIGDMFEGEASAETLILAPAMTISKSAPAYANTGETIVYSITYSNEGTAPAYGVVITDVLPAGVSYISSSPSGTLSGSTVTWNIGTLAVGASGTITVTVQVTATSGTLMNSASADYENQFGIEYPTEWAYGYTEIINPVLTVEKTAPATANTGQTIRYDIWVNNTGNDIAYNVVLMDTLPAGVTFVTATAPFVIAGQVITWNLGSLGPGAAVLRQVWVTVNANVSGLLVNLARATYDNSVGLPQQPVSDTAETLVGDPSMEISKSAPLTANAGETIMYVIRYWNNGTDAAYNVVITENYPADVTFVDANPNATSGNNIWIIPVVPAGTGGAIFINVTINAGTTGYIVNTVTLEYTDAADNIRPVESDEAVTVITGPYLLISKTGPAYANPGQVIMYTITYMNIGTDTAYNVWINETFPAYVTFLNSNPARASDYNWNIGDVGAGLSGTIFINVTVALNATGVLHNAVAAAYQDGMDERFGADAYWDTIVREPVLQITKDGPSGANPGQTITYWINYTNIGTDWAYNVWINETYPALVDFVSSIPAATVGNYAWNIGVLAPGASGTIQVTVTINATIEAPFITNLVTGEYQNSAGLDKEPVTAELVTWITNPLIVLEKSAVTVVSGYVFPGEIYTYTVFYSNAGTDWAYDVRITEAYPSGVSFLSAVPMPTIGNNIWMIGTLAPGAGGSIVITVSLSAAAIPGTFVNNTATATYRNTVGPMPEAVATNTLEVIAPALQILKEAPSSVNTGGTIIYRVWIFNIGNAPATGIVLTESYDSDVTFVTAAPYPDVAPNVWFVPTIMPGLWWFVDITVRVNNDAFGWIINNVEATYRDQAGTEYPPVQAQNRTQVVDPLMSVSKEGPTQANPGQAISYWVNVTNSGTDSAVDVVITDQLPADVAYVSSVPAGTLTGQTLTWAMASLPPGTISIRINVVISASASGTLYNYVTADYSSMVRAFPQESDYLETLLVEPDMRMTKTAPAYANSGQAITYWLNYTNAGTDWAYNVVITEHYPLGVTYFSATPMPTVFPNVWNIGAVAPGQSGSIMITVFVDADAVGFLENTAVLSYESGALPMDDVQASALTEIIDPYLTIVKDAPAYATQGETVTYTITVENIGTDTAYNVWVYESYPGEASYNSATPAPTLGDSAWFFPAIPAHTSVTITISVTFSMSASGTVVNQARVVYQDANGEQQADEHASDSTYVTGPSMQMTKWATPHANATELVTYWLNFTNTGEGWARNVVVTESYPAGVTFVTAMPFPTTSPDTWAIGDVAPGATVRIQITVQVNLGMTGILLNRAQVDYGNDIGIPYLPVQAVAITTLGDIPNLEIDKTGPQYTNVGRTITYTIFYSNPTNIPASNVWVNDTLPYGVTFVDATPGYINNDPTYCWNVGTLAPGAGGWIFINATVNGDRYGTITNLAVVEYQNSTGYQYSNFDTASTIVRDALMQVTKTGPVTANIGQVFQYTISYTNVGNDTAWSAVLVDTLPAGITYQTAAPLPSTVVGQVLTWNLGNLAPGATGTITVTAQAATSGVKVNIVTVDYTTIAAMPYPQETATWTTIVAMPTGYLTIDKSAPAEAVPGETITYTLTYRNVGLGAANNVVVTDTLPAGATYSPVATPPPTSVVGQVITWNFPSLAAGASGTITVSATIGASVTGTLMNTASITAATLNTDWAFANTTVVNPAMTITKDVDMQVASNGDTLNYTITYTNIGTAPAYNVTVVDPVPAGSTFAGATPWPSILVPPTWVFPILPAGSSGVIYVEVDVAINSGTVVNNVSLTYNNSADLAYGPVYAEATTEISDVVLQIEKIAPATAEPGTQMNYFINIFNAGPGNTANVIVTDLLPAGVTFVACFLDTGAGFGPDLGPGPWNLGPMNAFESWTLQIVVDIDPLAPDVLVNTAYVNFTDTSSAWHSLVDTATTTIRGPQMDMTKAASKEFVSPGELFTYTINYVNNGPGPAFDVTIREYYPAGVTFVSASPAPSSGNNIWYLGMIGGRNNPPNSGQITITVRVNTNAGGILTNWVTLNYQNISGGQMPEVRADATNRVLIGITRMYVDKTGPSTATTGQVLTYSIYYQNIGTGLARNVVLEDYFTAADFSYIGSSVAADYFTATRVGWYLGDLAPGARGTITVTLRVGLAPGISARNDASLNFTDTLGTPGSVGDGVTTWIYVPTMTLSKAAPATANSGEYITYTLGYSNTNLYAFAHNVTITETYPAGAQYISANPAPTAGNNTWFLGDVAPGGSGTITITVRVRTTVASNTSLVNSAVLAYENLAYVHMTDVPASATTLVLDPLLTVRKSAPATANSGQTITYTIWVNNTGDATAHDIIVTEAYPGGVDFVSAVPAPDFGDNTWFVASLGQGMGFTIVVTMAIRQSVPSRTNLTNTVTVGYNDAAGETQAQVGATATTQVLNPLVIVTKTGPAIAGTGQNITYTVVVENVGDAAAYGVQLFEYYPANLTSLWVTYVNSTITPASGSDTWNVGTLAPGASWTLQVTVTVDVQYDLTNTVEVSYTDAASGAYPTVSDSWLTSVQNPYVVLTKTANATAVASGYVLYNITAENIGTGSALNLTVTETYPAGVAFVSADTAPTVGDNVWEFPDLPAGAIGWLNILVRVADNVSIGAVLENTVSLAFRSPANFTMPTLTAAANTTIIGPEMAILKTAPAYVELGEVFNYTIRYWNNGTDWAYNVAIRDSYPLGIAFVNVSPAPATMAVGYYEWAIPAVAPNTWGEIQLTVYSTVPGVIINAATLDCENSAGLALPQIYSQTATQVGVVAPVQPPYVESTPPEFVWAGQAFVLYADALSFGSDVVSVVLYFTGIDGVQWNSVMLQLLVSANGSGMYMLAIPEQPFKGIVSYFVWVMDSNGNANRTGVFDIPVRLPPYFVWGNIYSNRGASVAGAIVQITDTATNETVIAYTDSAGRYQIDLATLYSGYMNGEGLAVFATDGMFYGSNESAINLDEYDDATMAWPNRQVNVVLSDIPEFAAIIVPILGMLLLAMLLRRQRRKDADESGY